MPCHDHERNDPPNWYTERDSAAVSRAATLTDLLCKVGRAYFGKTKIPPEVMQWWDQHAKLDAQNNEPWPNQKTKQE